MNVKICGLRRVDDAQLALDLGATHLGVVLAADSPRCATLDEARAIAACARGRAEVVLVFRGSSDAAILAASRACGVSRVQVHDADGARNAALRELELEPVAVVHVGADAVRLPTLAPAPSAARPALFDGGSGGAGRAFRWSLLGDRGPEGVFVAGGITPANVVALLDHRPWGIDLASGVEAAPGLKDVHRMHALFAAVQRHREVSA